MLQLLAYNPAIDHYHVMRFSPPLTAKALGRASLRCLAIDLGCTSRDDGFGNISVAILLLLPCLAGYMKSFSVRNCLPEFMHVMIYVSQVLLPVL